MAGDRLIVMSEPCADVTTWPDVAGMGIVLVFTAFFLWLVLK